MGDSIRRMDHGAQVMGSEANVASAKQGQDRGPEQTEAGASLASIRSSQQADDQEREKNEQFVKVLRKKHGLAQLDKASLLIQSNFRCFLALRVFVRHSIRKREEDEIANFLAPLTEVYGREKLDAAATKMQKLTRSFLSRLRVQRIVAGKLRQKLSLFLLDLRGKHGSERLEEASLLLQTNLRCFQARAAVRRGVHEKKMASLNAYMALLIRKRGRIRLEMFGLRIQTNTRCFLGRMRVRRAISMQLVDTVVMVEDFIFQTVMAPVMDRAVERRRGIEAAFILQHSWKMSRARKAMQERVALYNRAIFEAAQESAASVFALVLDKAVARNMFHVAACVLQSNVRKVIAVETRKELEEMQRYLGFIATKIQAVFRGFRGRMRILLWDTPKHNAAALQIQRAYRGMVGRDRAKERRKVYEAECKAATVIETQARVWLAKRIAEMRRLDLLWPPTFLLSSACCQTLQRAWRGHDARAKLQSLILANFIMRREEARLKAYLASMTLQGAWRAHLARLAWRDTVRDNYALIISRVRARKAKKDAAAQSLQEEAALQEPDVSIDLAELETESGEAVPEEDDEFTINAKVLQRTWRGHRGRSYIRWRWGWDHRIWENENLKVVSKTRAAKRLRCFFKMSFHRKQYEGMVWILVEAYKEKEETFAANPRLRRVVVHNTELTASLTCVEETSGNRVEIDWKSSAELWGEVDQGQSRTWKVWRNDIKKVVKTIVLTVNTPRHPSMEISTHAQGEPHLLIPGWEYPPGLRGSMSLATILRLASRDEEAPKPAKKGFDPILAQLNLSYPPPSGEPIVWVKGEGANISWKSSDERRSSLKSTGTSFIQTVQLQLLEDGELVHIIARKVPNVGHYRWRVSDDVGPSSRYKEEVWHRGALENEEEFQKRMKYQKTLRDPSGAVLPSSDVLKFMTPEYSLRIVATAMKECGENGLTRPISDTESDHLSDVSVPIFIAPNAPRIKQKRLKTPDTLEAAESPEDPDIWFTFPRGAGCVLMAGKVQTISWKWRVAITQVRVMLLHHGKPVAELVDKCVNAGTTKILVPKSVPQGPGFQLRVASLPDGGPSADSVSFSVAHPGKEVKFRSVLGGEVSAEAFLPYLGPRHSAAYMRPDHRKRYFALEAGDNAPLAPLDMDLQRTDGTMIPKMPAHMRAAYAPKWDEGSGPDRSRSQFASRPEVRGAGERELFEIWRAKGRPDGLDRVLDGMGEMCERLKEESRARILYRPLLDAVQTVMPRTDRAYGLISTSLGMDPDGEVPALPPELSELLDHGSQPQSEDQDATRGAWLDREDQYDVGPEGSGGESKFDPRLLETIRSGGVGDWMMTNVPLEEVSKEYSVVAADAIRAEKEREEHLASRRSEAATAKRELRAKAMERSKWIQHNGAMIRASAPLLVPEDVTTTSVWDALDPAALDAALTAPPPPPVWKPVHLDHSSPAQDIPSDRSSKHRDRTVPLRDRRQKQERVTQRVYASLPVAKSFMDKPASRKPFRSGREIPTHSDIHGEPIGTATSQQTDHIEQHESGEHGFDLSEVDVESRFPTLESVVDHPVHLDRGQDRTDGSDSQGQNAHPFGRTPSNNLPATKERTSKMTFMVGAWGKKTQIRGDAGTKFLNRFRSKQEANEQMMAMQRQRVMEHQLAQLKMLEEGGDFTQTWPHAKRHAERAPKRLGSNAQVPGESELPLFSGATVGDSEEYASCRIDYDPVRMAREMCELEAAKAASRGSQGIGSLGSGSQRASAMGDSRGSAISNGLGDTEPPDNTLV